ncbi:TPA: TolC family protein, partial [Klebsiella pneumoniae]
MNMHIITTALFAAALAGCAVGPQYRAPMPKPAPLPVSDASELSSGYDMAFFEARWWGQFEDPALDQIVQAVLDGNRDLAVAYSRLRAAQAHRADTANDLYPVVGTSASGEFGKGQQPGVTEERVRTERYDLGLDMAWEIDLFGRLQRQLEASDAEAGAVAADLAQVQVSLIAEAVATYGDLRGAQLRQRIALENLANQRVSGELTRQLHDAGLGETLDVLRNDALLAATEASIPLLQADEARARHRLFTLVGQREQHAQLDLAPRALPAIAKPLQIG